MSIQFTAENHKYTSLDPQEQILWTSVTSMIGKFKPKFDAPAVAERCSKSRKSKWKGLKPEAILEIWRKENERATTLGTWYHLQRERELLACEILRRDGLNLPIVQVHEENDIKYAGSQILGPGIYPEHIVYLKSAALCGQADRVEIVGDRVDIYDYKTNKELKLKSFTDWEGKKTMMLGPCSHLEHCDINHYALQLSAYMYMILKHNHYLNPGIMQIEHITFEQEGVDEFGYPITKYDELGEPIVKEVKSYDLPYLKSEIINILKCEQSEKPV